jgi:dephospho-CoA kinase
MLLKIGITGGIGVGKSIVCKIFASLQIPIYDADTRAKYLMVNDLALIDAIKTSFGETAYTANQQINRDFFVQQVFGNPQTAKQLESLVHPAVKKDFENWVLQQDNITKYVLKEAALLYESNSYQELDKIIVVTADKNIRIQRILQRDTHRNQAQIEAIMAKQLPEEEKIAKADFVIHNNGTELLIPQVIEIHQQIIKLHTKLN